jgi:hypothetical protein
MPLSVTIDTAPMRRLSSAMKDAPRHIRTEMVEAMRTAVAPVEAEVRASARTTLPGDLGEWTALLQVQTRAASSGPRTGVTLEATMNRKPAAKSGRRAGPRADLNAINRGRVMHYAWGQSRKGGAGLFGPQMVKPGFWTGPLRSTTAVRARKEIEAAMIRAASRVAAAAATR